MKMLATVLALVLPLAAGAQTIWRCGPDGRSYSDTPCADGRSLEALEPRPADDVADAQQRATRERRDAETMTRERLALEARQRGDGVGGFRPAPVAQAQAARPQAAKKKPRRPAAEAGTWRATAPSSRQTKG